MIFFLSLLLLVWGGLQLIITVILRVIIIVRCKGCGIWVLTAFWGILFQLAISPFSWVDVAMELQLAISPFSWVDAAMEGVMMRDDGD
jgi:hypothetical protein